jgi:hypothetical protein
MRRDPPWLEMRPGVLAPRRPPGLRPFVPSRQPMLPSDIVALLAAGCPDQERGGAGYKTPGIVQLLPPVGNDCGPDVVVTAPLQQDSRKTHVPGIPSRQYPEKCRSLGATPTSRRVLARVVMRPASPAIQI